LNVSHSKENILKKIRKALTESTPIPFPQSEGNSSVFRPASDELEMQFAEEFTSLLGKFVFCLNHSELTKNLFELLQHKEWKKVFCSEPALRSMLSAKDIRLFSDTTLQDCEVSVTSCECLIARTGTILLTAAQQDGRTASVYAPIHICIAYTNQLVFDIKDAIQRVKEKYGQQLPSLLTFATGPSRTADIEKTLVVGVHGPKEVYVFLVDQASEGK
jgi:L-lactate dehydrogenase complex protein LldG